MYIAAAVRCAPPANKPTPTERDTCAPFLVRELGLLTEVRVVVALARSAGTRRCGRWLSSATRRGPVPRFGHGAEAGWAVALLGTYHPSQQNTFTGRLTPAMFGAVIRRANALAASRADSVAPGPSDSR